MCLDEGFMSTMDVWADKNTFAASAAADVTSFEYALTRTQGVLKAEKDRLQLLLDLTSQIASNWSFVMFFAPRRELFAVLSSAMLLPSICLTKKAALCGSLRLTLRDRKSVV